MPKQAEVNIGLVGHVDHGKTTLAKALSGEWTDRHSEEIRRGISIKLGYADVTVYKCLKCKPPASYSPSPKCPKCGGKAEPIRRISLVDAPGHEVLMATMISGAALMDGALLLIAADEKCPQPQTREHLAALEIIGVDKIIIAQNKVELVTEKEALDNYKEIKRFVEGSIAENAPIIPISAMFGTNIDFLIQTIEEVIPTPKRDLEKPGLFYVARSFDINKPGTRPEDLQGGVIGGTIVQGKISVGEQLEIRPGIPVKKDKTSLVYEPILTSVTSIQTGTGNPLKTAHPSGLIGLRTNLDPAITRADALIGNLAGPIGQLPPIVEEFSLKTHLLKRVVGAVDQIAVQNIKQNETLMLIVGSSATVGQVVKIQSKNINRFVLRKPVAIIPGQRVAISRQIEMRWRLIGWGTVIEN
ncbi:MAG: translation initiation factor IF-2 subunit gamma [Candidatus Thorarchaeota archaeon]